MTENELKNLLAAVTPPDEAARAAAHAHWAALAKPLGGLGRLEAMVEDAAALTGDPVPDVSRRAVLVLCADNGVVAQGVSQTDAYVTRAVLENLTARRTSVCRMAAAAHCDVVPVDMGIAGAPVPGAADCRIAAGTADFTTGHRRGHRAGAHAEAKRRTAAGDGGDGHRQHNDVQRRGQRAAGPPCGRDDRARRGTFRRRTAAQNRCDRTRHCPQPPRRRGPAGGAGGAGRL